MRNRVSEKERMYAREHRNAQVRSRFYTFRPILGQIYHKTISITRLKTSTEHRVKIRRGLVSIFYIGYSMQIEVGTELPFPSSLVSSKRAWYVFLTLPLHFFPACLVWYRYLRPDFDLPRDR